MRIHYHLPNGTGLLLGGSGVYWVLSAQLISSPTALAPGLLETSTGVLLLLLVGIVCILLSIPFLTRDVRALSRLFGERDGWLFTLPLGLAPLDLELTLIGLSTGRVVELNPFVLATTTAGPIIILLFLLSYMALSMGLGVLMLGVGRKFYSSSSPKLQVLPYALVCGVAGFGPFSNLSLIILGGASAGVGYVFGILGSGLLSYGTYRSIGNRRIIVGH